MAIAERYRLIELETTESTNRECLQAAQNGDPGNLWIRADQQLAGRGSRGRSWESPVGNHYASLLLINPAETERLPELTFVASLALHRAVKQLATRNGVDPDIELKWPNDLLIGRRKVSGILLENHVLNDGRRAVIAGFGINCASHPEETLHKATNLAEQGIATTPAEMLSVLSENMASVLDQWDRGRAFATIRRNWLQRARGLGENIVVRLPGEELQGMFAGIDAGGLLELRLADGRIRTVSTADIFPME